MGPGGLGDAFGTHADGASETRRAPAAVWPVDRGAGALWSVIDVSVSPVANTAKSIPKVVHTRTRQAAAPFADVSMLVQADGADPDVIRARASCYREVGASPMVVFPATARAPAPMPRGFRGGLGGYRSGSMRRGAPCVTHCISGFITCVHSHAWRVFDVVRSAGLGCVRVRRLPVGSRRRGAPLVFRNVFPARPVVCIATPGGILMWCGPPGWGACVRKVRDISGYKSEQQGMGAHSQHTARR